MHELLLLSPLVNRTVYLHKQTEIRWELGTRMFSGRIKHTAVTIQCSAQSNQFTLQTEQIQVICKTGSSQVEYPPGEALSPPAVISSAVSKHCKYHFSRSGSNKTDLTSAKSFGKDHFCFVVNFMESKR